MSSNGTKQASLDQGDGDGDGDGNPKRNRTGDLADGALRSAQSADSLVRGASEIVARLVATTVEQASTFEASRNATRAIAAGIDEAVASAEELLRSQRIVGDAARAIHQMSDGDASTL